MKYNYNRNRTAAKILALMMILALCMPANAQVRVPFTQRTSQYSTGKKIYNIKGDFQMIGNTNLKLTNYSDGGNNSSDMNFVDVDGIPSTLNSSSATLTFPVENNSLPACSNIIYAGLYWIGRAHDGTSANTFMAGGATNNYINTNTVSGYTLTISSTTGNPQIATYTFTPATGNPVIFKLTTTDTETVTALTVQIGTAGTPSPLTNTITDSSSGFLGGEDFVEATFNNPYVLNTGAVNIVVNNLRASTDNNTIDGTFQVNVTSGGKILDKSVVYLKHATESTYATVSASDVTFAQNIYYPTTTDGYMYSAYAEVTDYVKIHGLGVYTVADIALREGNGGNTGYFGGWGMIVVYENSKMKWRDVTIFDGHAYVTGGTSASYQLPVSGFRTAQNGAVSMKLGLIAGEGDRSISGDYFQILPHTKLALPTPAEADWVSLSHSGNTTDNFFNSSIPAPNPRNPSLLNNTGVDIAMFNISNTNNTIVTNNQASTRFRYGSTQDTYIIPVIAMAVDAYVPDMVVDNTVLLINNLPYHAGMTVHPGEDIEYEIHIYNKGNEQINNARLVIPIPYSASYVPGSLTGTYDYPGYTGPLPYFNSALGANGSIVWEGGIVPLPPTPDTLLGTLKFKLKATTDCFIIANQNCVPRLTVDGSTSGVGAVSGTVFENVKFIQGYNMSGACQGEPIYDPVSLTIDGAAWVAANCPTDQDYTVQHFNYCYFVRTAIPFSDVTGNFPPGTRYWSALVPNTNTPATHAVEYTAASGFPNTVGTSTYYAVPPGVTTCWWQFTITITNCNLWYGGTDQDWAKPVNWTNSHVPNGALDSVIYATPLNYGQQALRDLTLDQNRIIGKVVNHSDKRLIIPVNKTLVVDKTADTGNAPQLVIESGLSQGNGALIFNSPASNSSVQATVQYDSKSQKVTTGVYPREWQYIGTPVNNATPVSVFGPTVSGSKYGPPASVLIRKYSESKNDPSDIGDKWMDVTVTAPMTPFAGYEVVQPTANTDPGVYSFQGTLNVGSYTTGDLGFTNGVYFRGNYIIANSYAAPININKLLPSDFVNLENTIYLYNTGSRDQWLATAYGESSVGNPGTFYTVPIGAAPTLGVYQIPSLNGFMVRRLTTTTGYNATNPIRFNFTYARVETNLAAINSTITQPMLVKGAGAAPEVAVAETQDKYPLLKVDVLASNGVDRVQLLTVPNTTKQFDNGWDGYKLRTQTDAQIYAFVDGTDRFQVSSDRDLNGTILGFFNGTKETEFSLKFHFQDMNNVYSLLNLEDLQTGTITNITDGGTYRFSVTTASPEARFRIQGVKVQNMPTDIDNPIIISYYKQKDVAIVNQSEASGSLIIYDVAGRIVYQKPLPAGITNEKLKLSEGVYILEARAGSHSATLKVVIQ